MCGSLAAQAAAVLTVAIAVACSPKPTPPVAVVPPVVSRPVEAPVLPSDPNKKTSVLILPLRAESNLQGTARALDEMMLTSIGRLHLYQIMGPEDVNALLGVDKLKDAMGCDDTSCATQLAGALGAPYLVAGQLTQLGDDVVLSLRLLDTKSATVMSRGSARGAPTADTLSHVMTDALHDLLGLEVMAVHEVRTSTTLSGKPALYADYQSMLTNLSRLMSNLEYTSLLSTLDEYERRPPIATPPGQDARELLVFYRATACFALKRLPCVQDAAKSYLRSWPQGVYAHSMQSYVEQMATLKAQQRQRLEQFNKQLQTVQEKRAAGVLTEQQALEIAAHAALGAQAFDRAADLFAQLLTRADLNEDQWFTYAAERAMALEYLGDFDGERRLLESARSRNEDLFRVRGMNQTLGRLPR